MNLLLRMQEIREEGIEQGIEQGEKLKAIAVAKNMIAADMKVDFISNMTGLTKDEIEALIQEKE